MTKRNLNNFIWNMIGVSLNSFISLFYLIAVTRINGIESAGIFSFCYTFSLILYNFSIYGGRIYQVSDVKGEYDDNTYFTSKIFTVSFSIIVALLFSLVSGYALSKILIILFLMLVRGFETFSDVIYGIFQRQDRLDLVGKSMILKAIISFIIFYIIDTLTKNIIIASMSIVIINLIICLLFDYNYLIKIKKITINFNEKIKDLLYKTRYLFLFNFLTVLIINISRFVVDYKLPSSYQGYFGIIIMIPTVVALFGQFIIQPELVRLTNYFNSKDYKNYNKTIKKMLSFTLIISLICILCAYVLGPEILKIVYGLDFNKYRIILVMVILGGMFNVICTIFSNLLTIMRNMKAQFYLYLIVFIIGIILSYILVINNSLNGAFIAYLFTMIIEAIIFFIYYMFKIRKCFNG